MKRRTFIQSINAFIAGLFFPKLMEAQKNHPRPEFIELAKTTPLPASHYEDLAKQICVVPWSDPDASFVDDVEKAIELYGEGSFEAGTMKHLQEEQEKLKPFVIVGDKAEITIQKFPPEPDWDGIREYTEFEKDGIHYRAAKDLDEE